MVKAKDPGMASNVYLVQMSEIKAALPRTRRSVVSYSVVPQTHCPPIHPCVRMSPWLKMAAVKT